MLCSINLKNRGVSYLKKKSNKRLDFLPNINNKYSIRKFTVGTASILVGWCNINFWCWSRCS
ncbi:YSIRK-type signal peptide-containing protein [Staphylococcus haemolyticus]|uniref:YSIRK-type signal peptide-containing protein n=1 Tax=Staphylococcus haemolyticus TaxID=1283 RepID=UPI0009B53E47